MMNKIYTITASLFFLVFSVVGQTLGVLGGEFLYWVYENVMQLNMPSFFLLSAPHIISGIVGGWLSALVCSKVYSSYDPVFILIIPTIAMLISSAGFLITLVNSVVSFEIVMPVVTNILTLYFFYSCLNNLYPTVGIVIDLEKKEEESYLKQNNSNLEPKRSQHEKSRPQQESEQEQEHCKQEWDNLEREEHIQEKEDNGFPSYSIDKFEMFSDLTDDDLQLYLLHTFAEFMFLWQRISTSSDEEDAKFTDEVRMINRIAHFIVVSQLVISQNRLGSDYRSHIKKKIKALEEMLIPSQLLVLITKEVKEVFGDNCGNGLLVEIPRQAELTNISCPNWKDDLLFASIEIGGMVEREYFANQVPPK